MRWMKVFLIFGLIFAINTAQAENTTSKSTHVQAKKTVKKSQAKKRTRKNTARVKKNKPKTVKTRKKVAPVPLLPTVTISDSTDPAGRSKTIALVYQHLVPILKRNRVQGAAIIIYDHGVPRAYYYGNATSAPGDKVTSNTMFEIGSITKVFTSVILAYQVTQNRLNLNDPMIKYIRQLPATNNNLSKVTLEELAAHVNGFGEMPGQSVHNRYEFLNTFSRWRPRTQIGAWWHYSNIGFGLLGYALEGARNKSYGQLLQDAILAPLGMTETKLVGIYYNNLHYAQGHSWDGNPIDTTKKLLIIPAAGSIQSSGQDMQKFMAAALNLPGTPPAVAKAIQLTQRPYYQTPYGAQGLGWEIHQLSSLNVKGYLRNQPQFVTLHSSAVHHVEAPAFNSRGVMYDKTGSVAGFRSYMAIVPSLQTGIVVMVNRAIPRTQLVASTRRVLLNLLTGTN